MEHHFSGNVQFWLRTLGVLWCFWGGYFNAISFHILNYIILPDKIKKNIYAYKCLYTFLLRCMENKGWQRRRQQQQQRQQKRTDLNKIASLRHTMHLYSIGILFFLSIFFSSVVYCDTILSSLFLWCFSQERSISMLIFIDKILLSSYILFDMSLLQLSLFRIVKVLYCIYCRQREARTYFHSSVISFKCNIAMLYRSRWVPTKSIFNLTNMWICLSYFHFISKNCDTISHTPPIYI